MKKNKRKSMTAVLIMLYIVMAVGMIHGIHPFVHALGEKTVKLEIGAGADEVTASLSKKGVLTISGKGKTKDYTEETAPFLEYADRIRSVKIEEGITSIGDCLFYNCGNLKGSLTIPSSVIWIGDHAFGGQDKESAPKFHVVESRFTERTIGFLKEKQEQESSSAESAGELPEATPGNASGGPGETAKPEEGQPSEEDGNKESEAETPGASEVETSEGAGGEAGGAETSEGTGDGAAGPGASGGSEDAAAGPGTSGEIEDATGGTETPGETGNESGGKETPGETETPESSAPPTDMDISAKENVFTVTSGGIKGLLRDMPAFFSAESEAEAAEEPSETVAESTDEPSEAETESAVETTGADVDSDTGEKHTDSFSTPSQAQDTEKETEVIEETDGDGLLTNDLYDGAVDASILKAADLENYRLEAVTSQIVGVEIFYPGQRGAYLCEEENASFLEAAEIAGYQKTDRFIEVNMDGIKESVPVIDGVFYAPELPEDFPMPESAEDSIFVDEFCGWLLEDDLMTAESAAAIYEPGTPIPVAEETESVTLYGDWERTCRITPEIMVSTEAGTTRYTVVDGDTGEPIPRSEEYQVTYQWQICEPEYASEPSPDEAEEAEPLSGEPEEADLSDESSWKDIEGEVEAVYTRVSQPEDRFCYFRVRLSVQKITRFRSASESVVLFTESVLGTGEARSITVIYEPGDGGTGTAPEPETVREGDSISPKINPFTRASDDGKAFTGWKLTFAGTAAAKPSGTAVTNQEIVAEGGAELTLSVTSDTVTPTVTFTAQWSATTVYYVSTSGNDSNDGSRNYPFRTLGKAFSKFTPGSSAETNVIELLTSYTLTNKFWENNTYANNATIRGQGKDVTTITSSLDIYQQGDLILDNLKLYFNSGPLYSCCNYNLTMKKGTVFDCSSRYDSTAARNNGVPVGTPYSDFLVKHDGTFPSGAIYGPHGKTEDDPTRIVICDDDVKIGRFITDCRNPGNQITTADNPVYSEITFNGGSAGLFMCGGILGIPTWTNTVLNLNAGSIYNVTGSSNVNMTETVEKPVTGNFKVNMTGGTVTTLNGGSMGRGYSNNTHTIGNIDINISGGTVTTLYCGGSTGQVTGNVAVNISGGTIGTFFGGGYGESSFVSNYRANAARVNGDVTTVISGGTIENGVYAGGRGSSRSQGSGVINGSTSLLITGDARINGNVFGGGNGVSGDSTAAKVLGNSIITISGGTISGNVYGGGERGSIDGTTTLHILPGANIGGNIYGGGNNSGTVGNTVVNLNTSLGNSGSPKDIYGAGKESGTKVSGTASVNVQSGIILYGNVYGGGEKGEAGASNVLLSSGSSVFGNVFGGGNQADITGTVTVVLKPGAKAASYTNSSGNIYGGANDTGTVSGLISMDIAGSAVNVYGAGKGTGTSAAGGTSVTISDGAAVSGNVYGGGEIGQVTNTEVVLNGGTVNGNIFGGGNEAGAAQTEIKTSSGATVKGSIYGGSNEKETVTTAKIALSGDGSKAVNIFGGGKGPDTKVGASEVTAAAGTNFNGTVYGGSEKGKVTNSQIILKKDSTILHAFGGGSEADVGASVITVEKEAQAAGIYGGSNTSGTAGSAQLTIAGTVASAYGGGKGSGTLTTAPQLTVEAGGQVTALYGGGEEGKINNAPSITVKAGGEAVDVYGGSNTSGEVTSPVLSIGGTVTNVYGGGKGVGTVTHTPSVNAEAQAVIASIYGGGEDGETKGTTVTLKSGSRVSRVFGGGNRAGITGTAAIETKDGSHVYRVYGGSNSQGLVEKSVVTVNGTVEKIGDTAADEPPAVYGGGLGENTKTVATTVVIGPTGTVNGEVFGGGAKGPVTGDTSVTLKTPASSGTIKGNVYGGGDAAAVSGTASLSAQKGVSVAGSLYGGGKGSVAKVLNGTTVITAANVAGNVFGGGAEGPVGDETHTAGTHVDVVGGRVSEAGSGTGNVFGGSDKAKVYGSTLLHIGKRPAGDAGEDFETVNLTIDGTVFGGGNTTDNGDTFDASNPFVMGSAQVRIDASAGPDLKIGKSIFGDGNMCTVDGDRAITIINYNQSGSLVNTSIQRATSLILDKSNLELAGAVDSANLSPTISYSLNRIGDLVLKGGSTLKIQAPVNLVTSLTSQDASGAVVTTNATEDSAEPLSTENRLEIQQGVQMELRTNEDVSKAEYGVVSGYMVLNIYDKASGDIESGVYVLGGYEADESKGGFLYGTDQNKNQKILPTSDNRTWKNWAIGTDMSKMAIMVMADRPVVGKVVQIESPWPADGSIYKLVKDSVRISAEKDSFVLRNPEEIADVSIGNASDTLGLSISTGSLGWAEPVSVGYILGKSGNAAEQNQFGGTSDETLKTINNTTIKPKIQIEMTTRPGITVSDGTEEYPLTVEFQMEHVMENSDHSIVPLGKLTIILQIRRESIQSYEDVLISTAKEYVRGVEKYSFTDQNGGSGVTVAQQSSITLQYAKKWDGGGVGSDDHRLRFTTGDTLTGDGTPVNLPAGMTIQAVDRSGSYPVYAYYTVPESGSHSEVLLSQFTINGTAGKYNKSFGVNDPENYLFVLDFANTPDFQKEKLCATFEPIRNGAAANNTTPPKIVFSVSGKTDYQLESSSATGADGEGKAYDREGSIPLSYAIRRTGGSEVDTLWNEQEMGIRLRLRNRDLGEYIPVPKDWEVSNETETYTSNGGTVTVWLSNGMRQTNGELSIKLKAGDLPTGTYQWEMYLISAPLCHYPGSLTEQPLYINFSLREQRYSIEATDQDAAANRLYPSEADGTRGKIAMQVKMKADQEAATDHVTQRISLLKKNTAGVYEAIDFSELFTDLSGQSQTLPWAESSEWAYQLKQQLPVGTYRLKFEAVETTEGSEKVLTYDTENFVVTPE